MPALTKPQEKLATLTIAGIALSGITWYFSTMYAPAALSSEVQLNKQAIVTMQANMHTSELDTLLFRIEEVEDEIADLESMGDTLSEYEKFKLSKLRSRLTRYLAQYSSMGGTR